MKVAVKVQNLIESRLENFMLIDQHAGNELSFPASSRANNRYKTTWVCSDSFVHDLGLGTK